MRPSDYEFDLFLSYSHEGFSSQWVHNIFYDILEHRLTQALGRHPLIFLDRNGILSGDDWQRRIKNSLVSSKLLVPIWTINYFHSQWCRAECAVFCHREQQLRYRSIDNPSGLIHPVKLY